MLGVTRTAALQQGSALRARGDTLDPLLYPHGSSWHLAAELLFLPPPLSLHGARASLALAAAVASPIFSKSLHGGQCSCVLLPAHPEPLLPFVPPPLERFSPGPRDAPAVSPLQAGVKGHLWLLCRAGEAQTWSWWGWSLAGADPALRPSAFLNHFGGAWL